MAVITTHVLDTARGAPAGGLQIALERSAAANEWEVVGRGATDADGRLRTLTAESGSVAPGVYRLIFETRAYFDAQGVRTFYPYVNVTFEVTTADSHYHVPLLVSPFGYSTYRGW
jgi:5-hydroxyisourate hydrolase